LLALKVTGGDCYFREDLSHLLKTDTDIRCSGFLGEHASPLWHRQGDNRTVGRQPDAAVNYLFCQCVEVAWHQPAEGLELLPLPIPFQAGHWQGYCDDPREQSLYLAKARAPSTPHTQRLKR